MATRIRISKTFSPAPARASAYVGRRYDEVARELRAASVPFRVLSRDGQAYFGTTDYRPGRLGFDIVDGIITAARCG